MQLIDIELPRCENIQLENISKINTVSKIKSKFNELTHRDNAMSINLIPVISIDMFKNIIIHGTISCQTTYKLHQDQCKFIYMYVDCGRRFEKY